jgi:H+/Cl- antiporter ClcA
MQAPLAALALVLELTNSGFGLMVPMIATTVLATTVAFYIDGYSIYSARLPSRQPGRRKAAHLDASDPEPGDVISSGS